MCQRLRKNEKRPLTLFNFSYRVAHPYLTAESIICSLQWYLILTTAAKKFSEKRIHYTMNCAAEADSCGLFFFYEQQVLRKTVSVMAAWRFISPEHLAATRCTSVCYKCNNPRLFRRLYKHTKKDSMCIRARIQSQLLLALAFLRA